MNLANVDYEKKNHVAVLTIDHPPANAWNLQTTLDMEKAIDEVEKDDEVRVVVITGKGEKCFSAGFDVTDAKNSAAISARGRALWTRIDRFPKITIAAINGHALGGGLELALCCHFRVMADKPDARLGLTELNLGIIPGWGGTQRLARCIGRQRALEMILFSTRMTPQQAYASGLVSRLPAPADLMSETLDLAEKIAKRAPLAVRCVLEAISSGTYDGLHAGLLKEEAGSIFLRETEDRLEGFLAFREKRDPVFTGR